MASSTYVSHLEAQTPIERDLPRHPPMVRITHWISAASFLILVLSGIAILLAHPRLYWGETGAVGTPSLIDLPLPFVLEIPIRGPGRYLHFLAAWIIVFTGVVYVGYGLLTRHFARNLQPMREDLSVRVVFGVIRNHLQFKRPDEADFTTYNVLQRVSYTAVVFLLLPLMIWTGLAMSPAVTSVFPFLVTVFGGQQSARTIHFFVSVALIVFLLVHIAMVCQSGFKRRMKAITTGTDTLKEELR